MEFRFSSEKVHLTYKGHLPMDEYLAWVELNVAPIMWVSFVHEAPDDDCCSDKEKVPYEHTHVALFFKKRLETRNQRYFDWEGEHPHIKTRRSMKWFWHLFLEYHWKHPKGPVYNEPKDICEPHQIMPADIEVWMNRAVIEADTLEDAINIAGITTKSVTCCATLRQIAQKEAAEMEDDTADYDMSEFTKPPIPMEHLKACAHIVWGGQGLGKTQWSLAHFRNPLLVSNVEEIKRFNPIKHDGIVFDEASFTHMPREIQIAWIDQEIRRGLRVCHGYKSIPKRTPKIFVTNIDQGQCFDLLAEGIRRRFTRVHFDKDYRKRKRGIDLHLVQISGGADAPPTPSGVGTPQGACGDVATTGP